jgi:hypothetical protein
MKRCSFASLQTLGIILVVVCLATLLIFIGLLDKKPGDVDYNPGIMFAVGILVGGFIVILMAMLEGERFLKDLRRLGRRDRVRMIFRMKTIPTNELRRRLDPPT